MTSKFIPAVLLLVFISGACAARMSPQNMAMAEEHEGGWSLSDLTSGRIKEWFLPKHSGKNSGDAAYFACRFIVPPEMADDFEDAWMKYEDSISEEKGNNWIELKKTKDDNLMYISYSEWSSMDDWLDHLEGNYAKKFMDFLDENEIYMNLFPLDNRSGRDASYASHKVEKGKKSKNLHHVLIKYFVPPHKTDEFEGAWKDTAEDTWDEEGNHVYALRKVSSDNTQYWIFGTWKDADAYDVHIHSDHVQKLLEFNDDNGIVWFRYSLKKIGEELF